MSRPIRAGAPPSAISKPSSLRWGSPGAKGAVGAAEKLVRDVEEMGGVARGMNAGPRDEREVIVYGSEAARDNHQYALRLLALVREVVVDSSAVNGAAGGTPEAEAAPGVVTAEQWMRAFDSAGVWRERAARLLAAAAPREGDSAGALERGRRSAGDGFPFARERRLWVAGFFYTAEEGGFQTRPYGAVAGGVGHSEV